MFGESKYHFLCFTLLQRRKQETVIETMLRILRSGDRAPLKQKIHERLLSNHTYKELALILQRLLLKKVVLEDVETPKDIIDAELEETLMTWANNNREPFMGAHEEAAIKKFSRHLLGLFDADREALLRAEAKRRLGEPVRRSSVVQVMSPILEAAEESGEDGSDYVYKPVIPLYNYDALKFQTRRDEGSSDESASRYGIAGADTPSTKSYYSELGEGNPLLEAWEAIMRQGFGQAGNNEPIEDKMDSDEERERQKMMYWGDQPPDDDKDKGDNAAEKGPEEFEGQYVPPADWDPSGYPLDKYPSDTHPTSIHEHSPDTVCCITIRKFAEWIYCQAEFLAEWSAMYAKCLQALRKFNDCKVEYGITNEDDDAEQFRQLENIINGMMDTLAQFRQYIESVGSGVYDSFLGKDVLCCVKCLEENRLPETDDDPAHEQMNTLVVSIREMETYHAMLENWLDPNDIMQDICENLRKQVVKQRRKAWLKKQKEVISIFEIVEIASDSSMETQFGDLEEL